MADDFDAEDEGEQRPLDAAVELFQTDAGQRFANEAAIRINDFVTQKNIADANSQAAEAVTGSIADMQANYAAMVRNDPTATNLALDLANLGVRSIVDQIPGADPVHAETITAGMHRAIAAEAVRSAAERHEDFAQSLLSDERIANALGDDRPHLESYVTAQAAARRIDQQAAQLQAARDAAQRADAQAWKHLSGIQDDGDQIRFPQNWTKGVLADPVMPPEHKAALVDAYGRLMEHGDALTSDPVTVRDLVRSAANGQPVAVTDVLGRAGSDLTMADAATLTRLTSDPSQKGILGQINAHLGAAERQLATPENGMAGQIALDRFSQWLLGAVRGGAILDPSSQEYALQGNRMQVFAPQAADYADPVIGLQNRNMEASGFAYRGRDMMRSHSDRMSLDEIFSAKRQPPAGDQVIRNTRRSPPMEMPNPGQEVVGAPTVYFGEPHPKNLNPPGDEVIGP